MTERSPRSIIFGQPNFDDDEVDAAVAVIKSRWIGQGHVVEEFERELGEYLRSPNVIAVSSCTAALHLCLVALGIGPGDEVITTPFTFIATINAIEHAGATPVLVDIDPISLNLQPAAVEAAITPRTKAVMPVHFGGHPLDVARFRRLADQHDLWIIEDAAHAIGAVRDGSMIGGASDSRTLTCFSFYPNKNVATAEGGAISVKDPAIARTLKSLRLHGLEHDAWQRYHSSSYTPTLATAAGFKYNMTDLQAAIARVQLAKLEGFLATREYLAGVFDEKLSQLTDIHVVPRPEPGWTFRHALHLYQVALNDGVDRDRVVEQLRQVGIGAAVHYIGINQHPFYRDRFSQQVFPHSDWASRQILTMPLHPGLDLDDLEYMCVHLAQIVAESDVGIKQVLIEAQIRSSALGMTKTDDGVQQA